MQYQKIAIIADDTELAQKRARELITRYQFIFLAKNQELAKDIDLILVLGGDGFMLHCLHDYLHLNIPIYGINCGTVGFLLNHFDSEHLMTKLSKAVETITHPLEMKAKVLNGEEKIYHAINEVSLFRKTNQATKVKITINKEVRLPELVCDGVLLSSPAGSSAYNASVNGPILPIGSNILALTPISPFRPKKWGGAILPSNAIVEFTVLEPNLRPVNAVADFFEVEQITSVIIKERSDISIRLLFDENHSLEERIIKEQFA